MCIERAKKLGDAVGETSDISEAFPGQLLSVKKYAPQNTTRLTSRQYIRRKMTAKSPATSTRHPTHPRHHNTGTQEHKHGTSNQNMSRPCTVAGEWARQSCDSRVYVSFVFTSRRPPLAASWETGGTSCSGAQRPGRWW